MSNLYDEDFYEWTAQQTALMKTLLKTGQRGPLDLEHLIEEIGGMGASERRELHSRFKILLAHLLKWQFEPEGRGGSWRGTIDEQRDQLELLLQDSPSLQRQLPAVIAREYPRAVRLASDETGLSPTKFPATCPYAPEQALDPEFWPT